MLKYRFELLDMDPWGGLNHIERIVKDAELVGGTHTTTPWLKPNINGRYVYQFVINNLKDEDAAFLVLKHNLKLIRKEYDYTIGSRGC